MLSKKKFVKNNQGFTCVHCGSTVLPHDSSSRDHCNFCLWGMHVDLFPGDRDNPCKGFLKPVGVKKSGKKLQVEYRCLECNKTIFCVVAEDDSQVEILELMRSGL